MRKENHNSKGVIRMPTSSFNKDFTLNTKKAVESFERIISTPKKSIKIDRSLVSIENMRRGEQKVKQMLSRNDSTVANEK
jgi:hypothetical protein